MSTNTVTLFFALLALACNAFVVIVAVAWFAASARTAAVGQRRSN